ncbi:hypothetical protein BU23DRAFT_11541 [Bimuria novae-zelandiae CBS 107.79]|uniref:Uncharacterized protein n=1 Tax=Bimuria novae-zelandiae CBS 107.79 TaxID=1447943 RepID=A0A6A5VU16_9PLEO|nr:hypothetical protein BU23DRAFT_11541 [Bimuria novae-zelandiae CBS 107.79]
MSPHRKLRQPVSPKGAKGAQCLSSEDTRSRESVCESERASESWAAVGAVFPLSVLFFRRRHKHHHQCTGGHGQAAKSASGRTGPPAFSRLAC